MKVTRILNKQIYLFTFVLFISIMGVSQSLVSQESQEIANDNNQLFMGQISDDEYGGVYLDGDTLVILALTHPDDAKLNSLEKINNIVFNDSRMVTDNIRVEEARFSKSELNLVSDYLFKNHIEEDFLQFFATETNTNSIVIGLVDHVYDDNVLRNEAIEYIRGEVATLSDKEDFADIVIFERSGEVPELLIGELEVEKLEQV